MDKGIGRKKLWSQFRARYIALAMRVRDELVSKYPDKRDRAEGMIDIIIKKLYYLKGHSIGDYTHTVYQMCREFKEICMLMPSKEEIEGLGKT